MPTALALLQRYWQHAQFRPQQAEIIAAAVAGKDVLALLPTGGGKSICFQIPGLMRGGLTLVVSPLIALMQDQVMALNNKSIPAASIHSGLSQGEVQDILEKAAKGKLSFLYCSPERLESKVFQSWSTQLPLSLLVIDEAHCISQWGHDFRPPYRRLAATRQAFKTVPVMALTASATPAVAADICAQLGFSAHTIFRQSFTRPNLSYSHFKVAHKTEKLVSIFRNVAGSGLVYCSSRNGTKKIAAALLQAGIAADHYHAGLDPETREQKQADWISNKTRVMVCTNAFGMGIDKPDVRTVVHHDLPEALEHYYQEAGRAGRDGQKAYAVLLQSSKDLAERSIQASQKFPPLSLILKIYKHLAEFFQIPVGSGEGQSYDFDIEKFTRAFQLDTLTVINTLKLLEREGFLEFDESVFQLSQAGFLLTREELVIAEKTYPQWEDLTQALLRSYAGILEQKVSIRELALAKAMRWSGEKVTKGLKALHQLGVLVYEPKKESPQIKYLLNRANADYLNWGEKPYLENKERYQKRLQAMIQYAQLQDTCRSQFLGQYFGEAAAPVCGVCDNCLEQKKQPLSTQEFLDIKAGVLSALAAHITLPSSQVFSQWKHLGKAKTQSALQQMAQEELIQMDEQGQIALL